MHLIDDYANNRVLREDHPDFLKVRVQHLQEHVSRLTYAVAELQRRLEPIDDGPNDWPADTYA